jgi:hypothetical protein
MNPNPDGRDHLHRATRFQVGLLFLGLLLWGGLDSWRAALVFLVGGLTSLAYWGLHWLVTARMLTPSVRLRWVYAVLSLGKLALIIVVLRVMIGRFPAETLPLVTGLLLFVAGILLEALRLVIRATTSFPP